ncbi:MAG: HAD family acid phosphatase [Candidatus Kapaibacteriales bacterium]
MKRIFLTILLIFSTVLVKGQSPIIINLSDAKNAIREYYLRGQYEIELDEIIDDALPKVKQFQQAKNRAFVFDIDETALSNLQYELETDFGYIPELWNKWVLAEKAPAIPKVKEFYDSLVAWGYKIIFITGRNESQFQSTYNNLRKAGYSTIDTLICRTKEESELSAQEYKTKMRRELTEKGYFIVGSIGDQWSDLLGGYCLLQIKIPNYMYLIR